MSFWDELGGLFTGDTYFPDNPKREARAEELARDCQNYAALSAEAAIALKKSLQKLNGKLAAIFGEPTTDSPFAPQSIEYGGVVFDVAKIVAPPLLASAASWGLTVGATTYLVSTGEIGAAALVSLVGLPVAFTIGVGAGVVIVGIAVAVGIGAIEGAVKRDKLREAIHGATPVRISLHKAQMANEMLKSHVEAIVRAVDALREANVGGPTIEKSLETLAISSRNEVNCITDDSAIAALKQIDRSRGSWTNED